MSNAKKKRYANKMKNQPSNVKFPSNDQADRSVQLYNRGGGEHFRSQGTDFPTGFHDHKALETPRYITATRFAEARAAEISVMLKTVSRKASNTQIFQSLPKHMRRRAMGHDVKRLPRRLREMAKKEMDKMMTQKKEQPKSKCRKARRRHGNLLQEFNRRQLKNIWLETHIWHAKRFHMVKKWGYCLGDRPTTKSYRACFRAMTSHCLLQDLSYYCCLELVGKEEELLKSLAQLCSSETGPTFAATQYLSGKREGSLVLYKNNQYPQEVIGPVTFIWKPKDVPASSQNRQLWIWTHPAQKQDVLGELQAVCDCSKNAETTDGVGKKRKRVDKEGKIAVPLKKILGDGTRDPLKTYSWESASTGITVSDLTMDIVRYRLIGPLSQSVLAEALKAADLHKEMQASEADPHAWWTEYCKDSDNVSLHNRQATAFQLLHAVRSPAEIPSGTVIGLTTGDPRLNLPAKRSKAVPDLNVQDQEKVRQMTIEGVPVECAKTLMWNQAVRNSVTENKIPEQKINRLRRELLVPGSRLELGPSESKVPVLLIQQPGKVTGEELRGWGAGWDICLPKGWGMAFWISFIYRGARIGGLKEALHHSLCKGTPYIPNDFPDCPAGVQAAKELEAILLEKYKRRPPAKRTNYVKHGSVAPFLCPWKQLTHDWEARNKAETRANMAVTMGSKSCEDEMPVSASRTLLPEDSACVEMETIQDSASSQAEDTDQQSISFCVVRCRRTIKQLSHWCRPSLRKGQKVHHSIKQEMTSEDIAPLISLYPRSLVWIRLSLLKKGTPEMHAMVCIPLPEDLVQLSRDKVYSGPQEPKHRDIFRHKVIKFKKMKKKLKNSIRTETGSASSLEAACGTVEAASGSTEDNLKSEDIDGYEDLTLGLWPDSLPDVSSHCSRVVFGFVTRGDFSLAVGCGEAVGFVSLTGLLHMLATQPADRKGLVLVRNPGSIQYRFAQIVIDV
ncbi:ribonucleases P/MRP protein subunit POP1 [Lissotriton helveticus]